MALNTFLNLLMQGNIKHANNIKKMMEQNSKSFLTKELFISSFHIDLKGRLSINSLLLFFQEIAWEHATLNGFGYEDLKDQGFFWALSRMHVDIIALPQWTEKVKLTTWPSGTDGPFALRDYLIENEKGEKLIGATSSWLIVDINSRRPQRPDAFKDRMPICDTVRSVNSNAQRIDSNEGINYNSFNNTSRISDIDVNGHINNTKYVEWAVNAFNIEDYRSIEISKIDVNFLSEGFCNDTCNIATSIISETQYQTKVTRETDSKPLALVLITKV
jgi:medium-chain acyl-[acyl-carrier-protein] hydrolase